MKEEFSLYFFHFTQIYFQHCHKFSDTRYLEEECALFDPNIQ